MPASQICWAFSISAPCAFVARLRAFRVPDLTVFFLRAAIEAPSRPVPQLEYLIYCG